MMTPWIIQVKFNIKPMHASFLIFRQSTLHSSFLGFKQSKLTAQTHTPTVASNVFVVELMFVTAESVLNNKDIIYL